MKQFEIIRDSNGVSRLCEQPAKERPPNYGLTPGFYENQYHTWITSCPRVSADLTDLCSFDDPVPESAFTLRPGFHEMPNGRCMYCGNKSRNCLCLLAVPVEPHTLPAGFVPNESVIYVSPSGEQMTAYDGEQWHIYHRADIVGGMLLEAGKIRRERHECTEDKHVPGCNCPTKT